MSRLLRGAWLCAGGLVACSESSDLGGCTHVSAPAVAVSACNGAAALCSRRYDEVTYPTAHNAMSNADEGWYRPNQRYGLERALADGVRGFMIDAHPYRGEVYLCHARCELGRRPLRDALCALRDFLDRNPGEVVTLQIENYVPDGDLAAVFDAEGLGPYLHTQTRGAPWPTLGEMVSTGRRLVVFVEVGGGAPPWLLGLFEFSWDTPYRYASASAFDCAVGRGGPDAALFTINHFLTDTFGGEALAREANTVAVLQNRLQRCMAEHGRRPTFVAVDYYDVGAMFDVVRALNGL